MGNIEQSVLLTFLLPMKNSFPLVMLLLAIGCSKVNQEPQENLIVIDGEAITSADLRDSICFILKTQELGGQKKKPSFMANYVNGLGKRILPSLLANKLLEKYFAQAGIAADVDACETILSQYRQKCRRRDASLKDLILLYGEYGDYFRNQFDFECRLLAAQKQFAVEELTDELVSQKVLKTNRRNRVFKMFNDTSRKKAQRAWELLSQGTPWDEVAKEYSDDKSIYGDDCKFSEHWEEINEKLQFYIPEISKAVVGLKPGQFTMPVEADEGVIIARVNEHEGNVYKCSRILLRLFVVNDEMTQEGAMSELIAERKREFNRKIIAQMKECSKIEYPKGTNVEYDVWSLVSKKYFSNAGSNR